MKSERWFQFSLGKRRSSGQCSKKLHEIENILGWAVCQGRPVDLPMKLASTLRIIYQIMQKDGQQESIPIECIPPDC